MAGFYFQEATVTFCCSYLCIKPVVSEVKDMEISKQFTTQVCRKICIGGCFRPVLIVSNST